MDESCDFEGGFLGEGKCVLNEGECGEKRWVESPFGEFFLFSFFFFFLVPF